MESKVRFRRRKVRFSDRELGVLVEETLKAQNKLNRLLPNRVRNKAWRRILRKVNSVAKSRRTLNEVKKRWYDVKRQRGRDLERLYHQMTMRASGESCSSDEERGLCPTELASFVKEEPEEPTELQLQPDLFQADCKLNGQLMPCVPMIKLEDIAHHISATPLYSSTDMESLPEQNPPQLNRQTPPALDTLDSSCTDEIPNVDSPQSPRNSEIEDIPSPSAVVAAISAEMKQMNAACSALLASSTQLLSAVEGLNRVINAMNYQRSYFHQRMLDSLDNIAIMLKKHDGV
ncbi:nuclear apoptosis-inducing factor 1-like [Pygocentrus nattereri]|uniref:nuclear apoptosis-inducing factor 1-like n=1 Tax=Pygocentrus nattereri TaxID=42514 RepID=UPI001891BC9C|nr:nuclear apoptosis-inducing factor 1-like [Pygocentrus nattereri]